MDFFLSQKVFKDRLCCIVAIELMRQRLLRQDVTRFFLCLKTNWDEIWNFWTRFPFLTIYFSCSETHPSFGPSNIKALISQKRLCQIDPMSSWKNQDV